MWLRGYSFGVRSRTERRPASSYQFHIGTAKRPSSERLNRWREAVTNLANFLEARFWIPSLFSDTLLRCTS
ncbi:MAG: hypothetical protein DMG38_29115 [Acidobacteria bacterium]|nr:MAG: hypothetical protein DMG38_29115 [Acidobacteriota bacterium]